MPRQPASVEQMNWENGCSRAITSDALWKLDAYRSALFLLHVSRDDSRALVAAGGDSIASQLLSAVGSVSANIAEGYSRATRADRLRFMGYALGSARECVTWYLARSDLFNSSLLEARLMLIARTRALLLGLIRSLRGNDSPNSFEA